MVPIYISGHISAYYLAQSSSKSSQWKKSHNNRQKSEETKVKASWWLWSVSANSNSLIILSNKSIVFLEESGNLLAFFDTTLLTDLSFNNNQWSEDGYKLVLNGKLLNFFLNLCLQSVVTSSVVQLESTLHKLIRVQFSEVDLFWQRERIVEEAGSGNCYIRATSTTVSVQYFTTRCDSSFKGPSSLNKF